MKARKREEREGGKARELDREREREREGGREGGRERRKRREKGNIYRERQAW